MNLDVLHKQRKMKNAFAEGMWDIEDYRNANLYIHVMMVMLLVISTENYMMPYFSSAYLDQKIS